MVGFFPDLFIDFIRFGGNDEKRLLLVALVQRMQDLRGSKLKDNGVQRFVPAEQITCDRKNNAVPGENVIPCLNAEFLREKYGDKIGAAAGSVGIETERDGAGIQDAAEYSHKQDVVRHLKTGQSVRENTGQYDHQARIAGEFFSDMFIADKSRNGI